MSVMSWGDIQLDPPPGNALIAALQRLLAPGRVVGRIILVYVAVVIPVMSFLLAWNEAPNHPEWRSGELHALLSYFLTVRYGYAMLPLLGYSMVSMLLVTFARKRFGKWFAARFGVYTGVALGMHYTAIFTVSITSAPTWWAVIPRVPFIAVFAFCAAAIGLAIAHGTVLLSVWLYRQMGLKRFLILSIGLMVSFTLFSFLFSGADGPLDGLLVPLLVVFFVSLLCGPFWFLAAYTYLAIGLVREHWERGQFRIGQMLFVFTWLGGYLAACRASLELAYVEYQKLPATPPDHCYIATAAARGHRIVVRSHVIELGDGRRMIVNRQLQTLKYGEIALRALSPNSHRTLRRIYDWLGPKLACRLTPPLLADAAYLLLKPCEWCTALALNVLSPSWILRAKELYMPQTIGDSDPECEFRSG